MARSFAVFVAVVVLLVGVAVGQSFPPQVTAGSWTYKGTSLVFNFN